MHGSGNGGGGGGGVGGGGDDDDGDDEDDDYDDDGDDDDNDTDDHDNDTDDYPDFNEVLLLLALHAGVLLRNALHLLLVDVQARQKAKSALIEGGKNIQFC